MTTRREGRAKTAVLMVLVVLGIFAFRVFAPPWLLEFFWMQAGG